MMLRIVASMVFAAVAAMPGSAQAKDCEALPFIVYFEHGSSDLNVGSKAILDKAAEAFGGCGNIRVDGHTDPAGPADQNLRLSERRAQAVRAYLSGLGLSEATMTITGHGGTRPAVDTPKGVIDADNNRVEVSLPW